MLFYYLYYAKYVCNAMLILSLVITACALLAYAADSQRPDDDPQKKNYRLGTILLIPITWPLLLLAFISLFVLRVVLYGLFLVLFILFLLIAPRESREPSLPESILLKMGNAILKANKFLIELFLRPAAEEPETI